MRYLIIGRGRVARHFAFYFGHLKLEYRCWHRASSRDFEKDVAWASHVLLLITDAAIVPFVESHPCLANKTLVHFSGSLVCDSIIAAHPLMSFSSALYSPEFYPSIPFVMQGNHDQFETYLPGLPNQHYVIPLKDVPYYHSLCVMANNYTTLLWDKCLGEFSRRWGFPKEMLFPMMNQTVNNLMCLDKDALTGPLKRGDMATVERNLSALEGDSYHQVYQAFVNSFLESKREVL